MNIDNTDILKSKPVIELLTVANEYCYLIENIEKYKNEDILPIIQKLGTLLYLKGSVLPDIEPEDDSAKESYFTEEEWTILELKLKDKFAKQNTIWFPPTTLSKEIAIERTLSENITDVYQDLKDFLVLFQKNISSSQECAIAMCKELYEQRWGAELLQIVTHIHFLLVQKDDSKEDYEF